MSPITISAIEERIRRGLPAARLPHPIERRAAVAVVLREREAEIEVLLIRRARRAGDPWSGHVAFPGGRAAPEDPSVEATAIREAREELGLDLAAGEARLLGRLPEFAARARGRLIAGMAITPVLFEVRGDPPLTPDPREVAATCWVPLSALRSGSYDGRMVYWWRPLARLPLPLPFILACWRYRGFKIWGLTHRMLTAILAIAEETR